MEHNKHDSSAPIKKIPDDVAEALITIRDTDGTSFDKLTAIISNPFITDYLEMDDDVVGKLPVYLAQEQDLADKGKSVLCLSMLNMMPPKLEGLTWDTQLCVLMFDDVRKLRQELTWLLQGASPQQTPIRKRIQSILKRELHPYYLQWHSKLFKKIKIDADEFRGKPVKSLCIEHRQEFKNDTLKLRASIIGYISRMEPFSRCYEKEG